MSIGIGAGIFGDAPKHQFTCSRAGCSDEATTALLWRNPRIHAPERRKTWLACPAHHDALYAFLEARSFPIEVKETHELES